MLGEAWGGLVGLEKAWGSFGEFWGGQGRLVEACGGLLSLVEAWG